MKGLVLPLTSTLSNQALLAFTLLELFVLLAIVILIVALLVSALRSGTGKITQRAIDRLVKFECAEGKPSGEFPINLTEITQSILDVLTQGFTLENFRAKVKWRKDGRRCVYTIVVIGTDGNNQITRESEEFTVEPCP